MSWQSETQILDLEGGSRIHLTCRKCNYGWYENLDKFQEHLELKYLFLDELEPYFKCPIFGCTGHHFRLAKPYRGKVEAFVAGMP